MAKAVERDAGVPVWEHAGIICTGETYKDKVKLTFARGASLKDPTSLFNSSLEGNTRRAIDFHEGDKIDEKALKALIRAAVALNISMRAAARPVRSRKATKERLRRVPPTPRSSSRNPWRSPCRCETCRSRNPGPPFSSPSRVVPEGPFRDAGIGGRIDKMLIIAVVDIGQALKRVASASRTFCLPSKREPQGLLPRGISRTQSSEKNAMMRSRSCALKASHSSVSVDRMSIASSPSSRTGACSARA